MQVKGAYQFRVTRNSELIVDEEKSKTWRSHCATKLIGRGLSRAMRWRSRQCRPTSCARCGQFDLPENAVYRIQRRSTSIA
jgi:polyphosphate kinase